MTAATDVVGSWFSSGYYGHFRGKSRNDFICEYRQIAKPVPPNRFLHRAKQPTNKHVFSHHDNRESFLDSALYFEQGLGRKRVPNETYNFKQDFITWMPEKEYVERSRPVVSTYRVDFRYTGKSHGKAVPVPVPVPVPQIIIKRPKTSFEGVPTSTYRYAHSEGGPNKEVINARNNDALTLSQLNRKNRAMTARPSMERRRETVASCMNWISNTRPQSSGVNKPTGTQTEFMPHPPATCKVEDKHVSIHTEPIQIPPQRETTQVMIEPPKLAWTAPAATQEMAA